MRTGSLLAVGIAAVTVAGLAGCSGGSDSQSSSSAKTVNVQMTSDGCKATPDKVDAGPITFKISNSDAAAVSEVELLSDNRILAERENIAPGMAAVTFSHKLDGGTYQLYCPGATNEKTPFTVTGKAATPTGTVADQLKRASADYKQYVVTQVNSLVQSTQNLANAVHANNVAAAKDAYPKARPFYEHIEPVAGAFCTNGSANCAGNASVSLDFAIDARPAAVPPGNQWEGFHVLEKAIYAGGNLNGMQPVADRLMANVTQLQSILAKPNFTLAPSEIVNGAGDLLDEVSTTKLTGEEEAFSHIDFVDMHANIEGAEQAFAMVKPALRNVDPTLTQTVTGAFAKVDGLIDAFRDGTQPGGFKNFSAVTPEQKRQMAEAVLAVKEPLAQAGGKIAAAS